MKLSTTQWYRGRFLKNSLATIMTCKTQMFRINVIAPKREIWKRIICFYLIGNTRRMILNIVQSLFRRLGVDAPHKQKCRDGMEENQWQQGMNMWKRWQQLEIECWQHQIHIKSDMNGAKRGQPKRKSAMLVNILKHWAKLLVIWLVYLYTHFIKSN